MNLYALETRSVNSGSKRKHVKASSPAIVLSNEVQWRQFILPDFALIHQVSQSNPEAFPYREDSIRGFELYIVEQWVYERRATSVIVSYTGNDKDVLQGIRATLPAELDLWPKELHGYCRQISEYCTLKEIDKNTFIFITNLSLVPSTWSLVHVGCGDMRKIWAHYKVNFNLKRLKCTGRSSLMLIEPGQASFEKFFQIYKFDMMDTEQAKATVLMLVKLIQTFLSYFKLEWPRYCDGLLCKYTEMALDSWWPTYCFPYFRNEKQQLEWAVCPSSVAALISMVLKCYFKLAVEDLGSLKDPLDIEVFHSAVYNFQKRHGIERTSMLDIATINELLNVTSKISNNEILKIKRVVTSTVKDITGRDNPLNSSNASLSADLGYVVSHMQNCGIVKDIWLGRAKPQAILSNSDYTTVHYDNRNRFIDPSSTVELNSTQPTTAECREDTESKGLNSPHDVSWSKENTLEVPRFDREIIRRSSSPSLRDKACSSDISYAGQQKWKRCPSFSLLENLINEWSMPFEPSPVRIAHDLIKLQTFARITKRQTQASAMKSSDISSTYKEFRKASKKIPKLQLQDKRLSRKQGDLDKELEELESVVAKFKYEIKTLGFKVLEINECVLHSESKLRKMESYLADNSSLGNLKYSELVSDPQKLQEIASTMLRNESTKHQGILIDIFSNKIIPFLNNICSQFNAWIQRKPKAQ